MPIRKDTTTLIDTQIYNHPNTSLVFFHFDPPTSSDAEERWNNSAIELTSIDGKDLYVIDNFFTTEEGNDLRHYSETASFSMSSYGSSEAVSRGEEPAFSMSGKERWEFFFRPPTAISALYDLLGILAEQLNADITTLPWMLSDASTHGSPAVIANKLRSASQESMESGKHQDANPEKGIAFGIPILYASDLSYHPTQFINGEPGKPWLISAMVYATADNFLPNYRLGTAFYHSDGSLALEVACKHMRLVLFEGDITHTIAASTFPPSIDTWRVSYVFKLLLNPKEEQLSVKNNLLTRMSVL